ncbi:hypothetical protein Aspvir_001332 [Aspergillus viridinutans]|uniref:Uncharacterized protein n=1 Tax=Aspergillus viridinutans TaxID=75553 RepID=A0A9P3BTU6_ASPVI|nr:uncharacterized protein Aspvir_001332 [Aspergillus viridinutans]GIJ99206.1 hypothetical protein Aspvir_001332 [Aspergillus viridinutans]
MAAESQRTGMITVPTREGAAACALEVAGPHTVLAAGPEWVLEAHQLLGEP